MAHDPSFILQSCTKAVAGSEDAAHLLQQKARLEQAVSGSDPALTLDTQNAPIPVITEGSEPIPYSKFLFEQDRDGYRAVLLQYLESEQDTESQASDLVEESYEISFNLYESPFTPSNYEDSEETDPISEVTKLLSMKERSFHGFTEDQAWLNLG